MQKTSSAMNSPRPDAKSSSGGIFSPRPGTQTSATVDNFQLNQKQSPTAVPSRITADSKRIDMPSPRPDARSSSGGIFSPRPGTQTDSAVDDFNLEKTPEKKIPANIQVAAFDHKSTPSSRPDIKSSNHGIFSPSLGMQEIPEVLNRIKKESSSDKASPRPDVKSSTGGIFSPRPGTQADLEVDDFKLDQSAKKKIPASIPAHVTADIKTQSEPSPRPDMKSSKGGIFSPRPGTQSHPNIERIHKEKNIDKMSPRPDVKSSSGGIFSPGPGSQSDLTVDDFKLDQSAKKKIPASIPAHITADIEAQSEPSPRPDMKNSTGIFSPRPRTQSNPNIERIQKANADKASPRPDVKSSSGGIFSPRPGTQADLTVGDFKLDQKVKKKIPASIPAHVISNIETQSEPSPRPDMNSSKGGIFSPRPGTQSNPDVKSSSGGIFSPRPGSQTDLTVDDFKLDQNAKKKIPSSIPAHVSADLEAQSEPSPRPDMKSANGGIFSPRPGTQASPDIQRIQSDSPSGKASPRPDAKSSSGGIFSPRPGTQSNLTADDFSKASPRPDVNSSSNGVFSPRPGTQTNLKADDFKPKKVTPRIQQLKKGIGGKSSPRPDTKSSSGGIFSPRPGSQTNLTADDFKEKAEVVDVPNSNVQKRFWENVQIREQASTDSPRPDTKTDPGGLFSPRPGTQTDLTIDDFEEENQLPKKPAINVALPNVQKRSSDDIQKEDTTQTKLIASHFEEDIADPVIKENAAGKVDVPSVARRVTDQIQKEEAGGKASPRPDAGFIGGGLFGPRPGTQTNLTVDDFQRID